MRAIRLSIFFFAVVAAIWAMQPPLSAWLAVGRIRAAGCVTERAACERQLRRAGPAATLALRSGLQAPDDVTRMHCARVLALYNDRAGDSCLLEILREHNSANDSLGAAAEAMLLSIWDQRDGPPASLRENLARARGDEGEFLHSLDVLVDAYPGWSTGYLMRARLYARNGAGLEARRQAHIALMLEPHHFDAMIALADAALLLGAPDHAYRCLQQAVGTNPRIRNTLRDEIRETLKAIEQQRIRKRNKYRKEQPVARVKSWESRESWES